MSTDVGFNIITGRLTVNEWYSQLGGTCMATVLSYVVRHCTRDLRVYLALRQDCISSPCTDCGL